MPDADTIARLELAVVAAREAGEITLWYFRRGNFEVIRKADDSPVTIADRQAEQHLRTRISAAFPGDAILGEEFGEQPGDSGWRWILDPIDGTKSFIRGVPLYGTLIGVERDGECLIGVIHNPPGDECVYAAAGNGAWHIEGMQVPRPARVSATPSFDQALFLTSEVDGFHHVGRFNVLERLSAIAGVTRTWGDCYGYLMIATGRADAMIDPRMHVWDAAALLPILEEAGGTFTDWEGNRSITSGNGVATNGKLLEAVLAVTRP